MQLETGTIVDRYAVEGLLGQGGMAIVYRARHQQLGTLHALKVLLLPAKSIRERLVQEGRVQARLRHPNIVNVTDLVEIDGAPGLVMEYVPGPSLDELLRQCELTIDQVDLLARGILDGVAAAHEVDLVHRDLKPGNVLIEVRKDRLLPKITDFGLAKLVGDEGGGSRTRSGLAMGTPCYMAPEQIRDAKNVDHRADVFSLGAVLYELITGQRAFDGDDTFEIFSAVTSGGYTPVRELVPDAPDRMVEAIDRALDTDRDARIQTVEELAALWTGGTPKPVAATAFAPALLQRAEELGSGADDTPMSWSPAEGAATESGGTAVPTTGSGSETMDWSLDQPGAASAPSIAPPLTPPPAPQRANNRDSSVLPSALGLGALATFGLGAMLLLGLAGVGVIAGGAVFTASDAEGPVAATPAEVAVAPAAKPADPGEPAADPVAGDAIVDADELEEEEEAPLRQRSDGKERRTREAPPSPAPAPPPPAPDGDSRDAAPEEAEAEASVDDAVGEPVPDEEEAAPVAEEGQAEPTPTCRVEADFMLHPLTRGASAIGQAWLVGTKGRHTLPADVPAGTYRIEASFNQNDAIDVGSITVPAGGTLALACFNATKACKVE